MRNLFLAVFLLATGIFKPAFAREWPYPSAAVNPAIELAVAIQMLADSSKELRFSDNAYTREMKEYFQPYRNHPVVNAYKNAFSSTPMNLWVMILSGEKKPEPLFKAMHSFAQESKFQNFFKKNRPYYQRCVSEFLKRTEKYPDYVDAFEAYTGTAVSVQYKVLISPALAAPIANHIYPGPPQTVITVTGMEEISADFPERMLHEITHATFDSLAALHLEPIAATQDCFKPVAGRCRNGWSDCMQEHVAVALARSVVDTKVSEESVETPYLSAVLKALKNFEKNRIRYRNFSVFYPDLFSAFKPCPAPDPGPAAAAKELKADAQYRESLDLARRQYLKENNPAKALEIFNSLTQKFSKEALLWIEQAKVALIAGREEEAKSSLKTAQALRLEPAQVHEIAFIYQQAQEYPAALALFDSLVKKEPKNAVYLKDRGICKFLKGQKAEAFEDLEASIRIASTPSAFLTLGTLYEGEGRSQDALRLYEKALSRREPLSPEEADALSLIKKQRDQIVSRMK